MTNSIPLEELGFLFLGRNLFHLRGIAQRSLDAGVPLAFYQEEGRRSFIGRDYDRMLPQGREDYRIELLERMERNLEHETLRQPGCQTTLTTNRVDTGPLFRAWRFSLVPPITESWVRDYAHAQYGLNRMVEAYVLHQGIKENYPDVLRLTMCPL